MTWFKVDDRFTGHRKVGRLFDLAKNDTEALAAIGLWTVAGAYSMRELTDGRLTFGQLRSASGCDRKTIKKLTRFLIVAELWSGSETEIQFCDWLDYQPAAASVKTERKRERKRKQEARNNKGVRDLSGVESRRDTPRTSRRSPIGVPGDVRSASPPESEPPSGRSPRCPDPDPDPDPKAAAAAADTPGREPPGAVQPAPVREPWTPARVAACEAHLREPGERHLVATVLWARQNALRRQVDPAAPDPTLRATPGGQLSAIALALGSEHFTPAQLWRALDILAAEADELAEHGQPALSWLNGTWNWKLENLDRILAETPASVRARVRAKYGQASKTGDSEAREAAARAQQAVEKGQAEQRQEAEDAWTDVLEVVELVGVDGDWQRELPNSRTRMVIGQLSWQRIAAEQTRLHDEFVRRYLHGA